MKNGKLPCAHQVVRNLELFSKCMFCTHEHTYTCKRHLYMINNNVYCGYPFIIILYWTTLNLTCKTSQQALFNYTEQTISCSNR